VQDLATTETDSGGTTAPLGPRFLAAVIDGVIAVVLGVVPIIGGVAGAAYMLVRDGLDLELMDRRSIGKRMLDLRPVTLDGKPVDLAMSCQRNWMFALGGLAQALLFVPIVGWIAVPFVVLAAVGLTIVEVILVATDEEGRRWGDKLAGTRVIGRRGCSATRTARSMVVTAYCSCSECTNWERGSWKYLKLDFWNRYVNAGPDRGRRYDGRTASGTKPHEPQPGLFSLDSVVHPWLIPFRLLPWYVLPRDGTLAADTRHYPFGTRMYVPGYGPGVVEDRGGAIRGPSKLDVYFGSHRRARRWGRQHLDVEVLP
jgi:uncharacterized RDD family membrane protein YckC